MTEEWRKGNPLDILIARESKTCKGCKHELDVVIWGGRTKICQKSKNHGKRCKSFSERGRDDMA